MNFMSQYFFTSSGATNPCDQRTPLSSALTDRRAAEDWTRRDNCRLSWCGGVWLCNSPADRIGVHHDAQVPLEYLPRRYRNPRSTATEEVQRKARVRGELFLPTGRGDQRWVISAVPGSRDWHIKFLYYRYRVHGEVGSSHHRRVGRTSGST